MANVILNQKTKTITTTWVEDCIDVNNQVVQVERVNVEFYSLFNTYDLNMFLYGARQKEFTYKIVNK